MRYAEAVFHLIADPETLMTLLRHRHMALLALVATITLTLAPSPHAVAGDRQFETDWRKACAQFRNSFAEWNDQTYGSGTYDTRFLNSNHADVREWKKENTVTLEFDNLYRSWIKPETLPPPSEEIDAYCKMLPGFHVGAYGYIESATVEAVNTGVGFVVRNIVLVDGAEVESDYQKDQVAYDQWLLKLRDQTAKENRERFRAGQALVAGPGWEGYITKRKEAMEARYRERRRLVEIQQRGADVRLMILGPVRGAMQPGKSWVGSRTQLVIVGYSDDPFNKGKKLLTALTADQFRRGFTALQLNDFLEAKGVTREKFVEMVNAANAADPATARQRVLAQLGYETQSAEPLPEPEPDEPTKAQRREEQLEKRQFNRAESKEQRRLMRFEKWKARQERQNKK